MSGGRRMISLSLRPNLRRRFSRKKFCNGEIGQHGQAGYRVDESLRHSMPGQAADTPAEDTPLKGGI